MQFSNVTIQQSRLKTADDPRHLNRQKIVQELFAWEAQKNSDGPPENKTPITALKEKTKKIIENSKQINELIVKCAPEWEISKINQIDLAILQLAVYELIFEASEPAKVVLDEAVELAKEFGTESSSSFVNGALGKALYFPIRIKRIISLQLGVDEDKIANDSNFQTDLNATDLEISDLMIRLEKEYNFTLSSEQKIETVGQLLEYVEDQQ